MTTVPEKFHLPCYKLHLGQLGGGRWEGEKWLVDLGNNTSVDACMVWLQGTVTAVEDEGDVVVIEDGGACCGKVVNCSSNPGAGCSWVRRGMYLQVVGQFLGKNKTSEVEVKCAKIVDLSDKNLLKQMWPLEVQELHNLIAGKVEFEE